MPVSTSPASDRGRRVPVPRAPREPGPRSAPLAALLVSVLLAGGAACRSPEDYRREADEDVYRLIAERGAELISGAADFTIEPDPDSLRERILTGEVTAIEPLTLGDCLVLAAGNNRAFQARKERLYLAALDLTLQRWNFSVQETGTFSALLIGTGGDAETASGSFFGTLGKLLGNGADVLGSIGLSIARNLGASDDWTAFTDVGLDVTLPLLRGSGELVVKEPLTQAERNLLYEVRAFERFRRTLAVDVAQQVYRLLQQMDTLQNEISNAESLALLREKNEALAEAGRLSEIQVDQARQDELRSRDRLLDAHRNLADQFDAFKLFLGLPIEFELSLDRSLLAALADRGVREELPSEDVAIAAALSERLDLLTARDTVADAVRGILVSEDALRAGFDLAASVDVFSDANQPLDLEFDEAAWSFSAFLDLPIDRLPERNVYRTALIAAQQAERELDELVDTIVTDLRASIRALAATQQSYEIQINAVELAERRVESARLNLDAGRAETRDVLEAQDSLLEAQNAATAALIDYALTELELYRDMEALRVEDGEIALVDLAPPPPPAEGGAPAPVEVRS